MSPRIVDRQERQAHLLNAAVTVFGGKGYHHATMQDVADEAGVSKGGLYDYFASKDEVLLCAAEWLMQNTNQATFSLLEQPGPLLPERVAQFVRAFILEVENLRPMAFAILQVWAELGHDAQGPLQALCAHIYTDFADRVQRTFDAEIASGAVPHFETRPAALAIMAILDGVLLQLMIAPDEFHTQRQSDCVPRMCAALIPQHGVTT